MGETSLIYSGSELLLFQNFKYCDSVIIIALISENLQKYKSYNMPNK